MIHVKSEISVFRIERKKNTMSITRERNVDKKKKGRYAFISSLKNVHMIKPI